MGIKTLIMAPIMAVAAIASTTPQAEDAPTSSALVARNSLHPTTSPMAQWEDAFFPPNIFTTGRLFHPTTSLMAQEDTVSASSTFITGMLSDSTTLPTTQEENMFAPSTFVTETLLDSTTSPTTQEEDTFSPSTLVTETLLDSTISSTIQNENRFAPSTLATTTVYVAAPTTARAEDALPPSTTATRASLQPTTSTTTVVVLPFATVALTARGRLNPKLKTYNPNLPMPAHTCLRDALAALANWRLFCASGVKSSFCLTRAPSIERCCAKWVKNNDEKYRDYPSYGKYTTLYHYNYETNEAYSTQEWIAQTEADTRQIVMLGWNEYKSGNKVCRDWRPEDDAQYMHFVQNFYFYNINEEAQYKKIMPKKV